MAPTGSRSLCRASRAEEVNDLPSFCGRQFVNIPRHAFRTVCDDCVEPAVAVALHVRAGQIRDRWKVLRYCRTSIAGQSVTRITVDPVQRAAGINGGVWGDGALEAQFSEVARHRELAPHWHRFFSSGAR